MVNKIWRMCLDFAGYPICVINGFDRCLTMVWKKSALFLMDAKAAQARLSEVTQRDDLANLMPSV